MNNIYNIPRSAKNGPQMKQLVCPKQETMAGTEQNYWILTRDLRKYIQHFTETTEGEINMKKNNHLGYSLVSKSVRVWILKSGQNIEQKHSLCTINKNARLLKTVK